MSIGGIWLRLGHDGRFAPAGDGAASSPGDGSLVVTNFTGQDPGQCINAVHAAGAIPLPVTGRWTVSYLALQVAIQNGTRVAFTPTTA